MKYMILLLLAISHLGLAQDQLASILQEIEANNAGLRALESELEATQLENHTGLGPNNPELGLNLLNGSPGGVGQRTDFSISQSFDYPTVYSHKRSLAKAKDEQLQLKREDFRLRLRIKARSLLLQTIYHNKRLSYLHQREQQAKEIAEAYHKMLIIGEGTKIEANKAAMNHVLAKQASLRERALRSQTLAQLQALNGGKVISLDLLEYPLPQLHTSFDDWIGDASTNNPLLQLGESNIALRQKEEKLSRALALPKFSAGYMSEKTTDERFQGLSLGVSLPLWENKNQHKLSKAQTEVSKQRQEDLKLQFHYHLKGIYERAKSFESIYLAMNKAINTYSTLPLLNKALKEGEMSLLTYFTEISFYFTSEDQLLESELEFMQAASELAVYQELK